MNELAAAVIAHIEGLVVSQGRGAGLPFEVFPWERDFVSGAVAPGIDVAALTIGRGNGKTTLASAIAHSALCGPLVVPRGETVVVASSFEQARLTFDHVVSFIDPTALKDRSRYRLWDSAQLARLKCIEHNTQLRCLASDPRRMHGIAPSLVLADEPAQWEGSKSEKAYAALQTSLGKIEGARLIAIGTKPIGVEHWFSSLLDSGADYSQSHVAPKDADPFDPATWAMANPSLPFMPTLLKVISREADRAKMHPDTLPMFSAYRLNQGVSDTVEALLLTADQWESAEGDAPRGLTYHLGLDIGTSSAQSAAAGFWPDGGRLECFAIFPAQPNFRERGRLDGVGDLYERLGARSELLVMGEKTTNLVKMMREVLKRWGPPVSISLDRWRYKELCEALIELDFPDVEIRVRGQGFLDGAEDVRRFRRAVLEDKVVPAVSLLMRNAMSEARVVVNVVGAAKLAKATEGGRRLRARDDAAAAAILAVASGSRVQPVPVSTGMAMAW